MDAIIGLQHCSCLNVCAGWWLCLYFGGCSNVACRARVQSVCSGSMCTWLVPLQTENMAWWWCTIYIVQWSTPYVIVIPCHAKSWVVGHAEVYAAWPVHHAIICGCIPATVRLNIYIYTCRNSNNYQLCSAYWLLPHVQQVYKKFPSMHSRLLEVSNFYS